MDHADLSEAVLGSDQAGLTVYAQDKGLFYTWDGETWERRIPCGAITSAQSGLVSTTSTSFVSAISHSVEIPVGRSIMVVVSGPSVANSNGLTDLAIFRDNLSLMAWTQPGRSGSVPTYERPRPLHMTVFDIPPGNTPEQITVSYSLQYRVNADTLGTSTLDSSEEAPLGLTVIEI
jgi:hypothetical protein